MMPDVAGEEAKRLFIALPLPPSVREVLAQLPQKISGVAWSRPEQWHLTLRFLGNVAPAQQDRLLAQLATVHVEPFIVPIEGVGTFPPNRPPRVVWVGTGSGHPRLFQLRQRVDDAVLAAGLDVDLRTFHPHVTLARCGEGVGPGLSQWLHAHRQFEAPPIQVASFELFQSELLPGGAVHTLVRSFPLQRAS
jgi:2'-5' RNA ligase